MDLKLIIQNLVGLADPDHTIIDIANIAMLNDGDEFLESKSPIVLSIVNIEEDKTLKNQSIYLKNTNNHTHISKFRHPGHHLILSVLFSSYNKDLSKYLEGIDKLKHVIFYFQQNNSFYIKGNELIEYTTYDAKTKAEQEGYSKITFELVSLGMDQLNQMWSYLGSRYMPSALYKMRLYEIQSTTTVPQSVIRKGEIQLWNEDQQDIAGLLETKVIKMSEA